MSYHFIEAVSEHIKNNKTLQPLHWGFFILYVNIFNQLLDANHPYHFNYLYLFQLVIVISIFNLFKP